MALKGKIYSIARQHDDLNTNELFQSMIDKSANQDTIVMDGRNIAAGSVFAEQIHAGAITANHIKSGAIETGHMDAGTIDVSVLKGSQLILPGINYGGVVINNSGISMKSTGTAKLDIKLSSASGFNITDRFNNQLIDINPSTGNVKMQVNKMSIGGYSAATTKDIDDIEIGGRNYFVIKDLTPKPLPLVGNDHEYTYNLKPNTTYTISTWNTKGSSFRINGEGVSLSVTGDKGYRVTTDSSGVLRIGLYSGTGETDQFINGPAKLKLEEGTIKTDWTPAPEDVEDSYTAVAEAKAETAEGNAKEYAKKQIDDIEVGGRNLLTRTSEEEQEVKTSSWSIGSWNPSLIIGEKYTFSFDIKSENATYLQYVFLNSSNSGFVSNHPISKEWTRVYFTFEWKGGTYNGTELVPHVYPRPNYSGTYVSRIKLEKGNKATDWTPAPEDVQAEIDSRPTFNDFDLTDKVTINGGNIKAGKISSKNNYSSIDLDNGSFSFGNGALTWNNNTLTIGGNNNLAPQISTVTKKISDNESVWGRASNINSNGTINAGKVSGQLINSQIASAGTWDAKETITGAQAKATAAETAAKNHADLNDKVFNMDGTAKKFINPASSDIATSSVTGYIIIRTPITSAFMTKLKISGYNYVSGKTNIDLDVGFYAYTGNTFHQYDFVSRGSYPIKDVRLGRDSAGRVVVILGTTSTHFSYPKISVDEAVLGFNTPPDSYRNGWSISISTSLSGISNVVSVSGVDTQSNLSNTKTKTDAWSFQGTTKIDGTSIETGTLKADQITTGTLSSRNSYSSINLDNGQFDFGNGALKWTGGKLIIGGNNNLADDISSLSKESKIENYIQTGLSIINGVVELPNIYFPDNGYIEFPDALKNEIQGKPAATIEFWLKKHDLDYGLLQLSGFRNSNGTIYPYGSADGGKQVYLDTFRTNRLGPLILKYDVTDAWNHFAVTTHPTHGWRLYQNGELIHHEAAQSVVDVSYLKFRIGQNSGNRNSHASYRDIRLWSKYRTEEEIAKGMSQEPNPLEDGLLGHWLNRQTSGETVRSDAGSPRYQATLNGDYSWRGTTTDMDYALSMANTTKRLTDGWKYSNTTEIDGTSIRTGTISADRIDANTLSAITANLGTVNAGSLNGKNLTMDLTTGDLKVMGQMTHTYGATEDAVISMKDGAVTSEGVGFLKNKAILSAGKLFLTDSSGHYFQSELSVSGLTVGGQSGEITTYKSKGVNLKSRAESGHSYDAEIDLAVSRNGVSGLALKGKTVRIALDGERANIRVNNAHVVGSGNNSNGDWVKFYDGTQICWHRWTNTGTGSHSDGNGKWRSGHISKNFAESFISIASVSVSAVGDWRTWFGADSISSSSFNGVIWRAGGAIASTQTLDYIAIGRWK